MELHTVAIDKPENLNVIVGQAHFICATANLVEIIEAETELGRGIAGVIDRRTPLGVETSDDVAERKTLVRSIGYKL